MHATRNAAARGFFRAANRCILSPATACLWLACALLLTLPGTGRALELNQYKHLRNEYVKVTDIRERTRDEERYVDSGGKVSLQKVPYKEVMLTAELSQRPPSSMDAMFSGNAAQPFFKICMTPFDAADKQLEDVCDSLRFQSLVKGNIGTVQFRLEDNVARYEFRMPGKPGDKGSAIKLWYPTN